MTRTKSSQAVPGPLMVASHWPPVLSQYHVPCRRGLRSHSLLSDSDLVLPPILAQHPRASSVFLIFAPDLSSPCPAAFRLVGLPLLRQLPLPLAVILYVLQLCLLRLPVPTLPESVLSVLISSTCAHHCSYQASVLDPFHTRVTAVQTPGPQGRP